MTHFKTLLRRFLRAEDAAVSVEAAIMMPVLIVFAVASYTYFESYRRGATLTKTAYAMTDVISRLDDPLTPRFIAGIEDMFEFVTGTDDDLLIRITQLRHEDGVLKLRWSHTNTGQDQLTQETLLLHLDHIPSLRPNEHLFVFEASALHMPAFNIGLPIRRAHAIVPSKTRSGFELEWDPTVLPQTADAASAADPA
ncbi:MAG: hypothetical protein AAF366_05520 [Pseudomonadota bacterium]